MTLALPAALAALSIFSHGGHAPRPDDQRIGAWILQVRRDAFAGQVACRLRAARVEYLRHALVIHLSRRVDTAGAIYRLDGGPAYWAQNDQLELAKLGFALTDDSDLGNPSGGLVRVPEERVAQARVIQVETRPDRRPVSLRIDGLAGALAAADKAGCSRDDFR